MLEDLIIWVLVAGIAMLGIAGAMLVANVMNNKSSLIASITLIAGAIFFGIIGLGCVAAFVVVAVLDAFVGIAATATALAVGVSTIAGTILGTAIALRYSNKQRADCEADPNCKLF